MSPLTGALRINNAIIEGGNLDVLKRAELAIRVFLRLYDSHLRRFGMQLSSGRHKSLNGSWTNLLFTIRLSPGFVLWNVRRRVGTSISSRYSKLALINTQTMRYGIQKWDGCP